MARWTAYLYENEAARAVGAMCAALGGGMYAHGATEVEALADAERQFFKPVPLEGLTGLTRDIAVKANARTAKVKAGPYVIRVIKQRGR